MFQIRIKAKYTISNTPYDLKGNNNNSEHNIESPMNMEKIPVLKYFRERNKPNKKTNKL